jgi:hypothetical protein
MRLALLKSLSLFHSLPPGALDATDAMCATLLLEVAEGGLCLLELLEVPEMMRRVLLSLLEMLEGMR